MRSPPRPISARSCARCSAPTRGPAGATPACCSTTRRAGMRSPVTRGAAADCRPASCRWTSTASTPSGSTCGSRRSPGAPWRSWRWCPSADLARFEAVVGFQMKLGDVIANALGYQGTHFRAVADDPAALDRALWDGHAPLGVRTAATFAATDDKRTTLYLALDHLAQHAPVPQSRIPLPAGAPFGAIGDRRRQVHDVPRVRGELPGRRDPRQRRDAAGALHRVEVRAMRPLRGDVPRARDRARAAARPHAGGAQRRAC